MSKKYAKFIKIQCESIAEIRSLVVALAEVLDWEGDPKFMMGRVPDDFYCYITNPEVLDNEYN